MTNIEVDLTINGILGLYKAYQLYAYSRIDSMCLRMEMLPIERVPPLFLAVKHFAKMRDLNDPGKRTIPGYQWCLLVISYLQHIGVLPHLQDVDALMSECGGNNIADGVKLWPMIGTPDAWIPSSKMERKCLHSIYERGEHYNVNYYVPWTGSDLRMGENDADSPVCGWPIVRGHSIVAANVQSSHLSFITSNHDPVHVLLRGFFSHMCSLTDADVVSVRLTVPDRAANSWMERYDDRMILVDPFDDSLNCFRVLKSGSTVPLFKSELERANRLLTAKCPYDLICTDVRRPSIPYHIILLEDRRQFEKDLEQDPDKWQCMVCQQWNVSTNYLCRIRDCSGMAPNYVPDDDDDFVL